MVCPFKTTFFSGISQILQNLVHPKFIKINPNRILRNTAECISWSFYGDECVLAPPMLKLYHGHDNRIY